MGGRASPPLFMRKCLILELYWSFQGFFAHRVNFTTKQQRLGKGSKNNFHLDSICPTTPAKVGADKERNYEYKSNQSNGTWSGSQIAARGAARPAAAAAAGAVVVCANAPRRRDRDGVETVAPGASGAGLSGVGSQEALRRDY